MITNKADKNKFVVAVLLTAVFIVGFSLTSIYAIKKYRWQELNKEYYNSMVWSNTTFLGVPMLQNPCDNQQMQELLFSLKPDIIIEAGTSSGGSTLFYATLIDQFKPTCKIFTIDIDPHTEAASKYRVWKEHVTAYTGSSTDPIVVDKIKKQIPPGSIVFVTLDSDHSRNHVYNELIIYSQLVTPGSYLVVQDTNVNGHPVIPTFGPGPMEALNDFLKENHNYVSDKSKEKFLLTFYPEGWLKRIK